MKLQKQYTELNIKIKGVDEDQAMLEAVFSNETQDRHNEIVMQNWDLKNYKKNPVLMNSHNYMDASEVIGKINDIKVKTDRESKEKTLEGEVQFAVNENPKAKIIWELYKNGFLNAFSVGFMPKEFDDEGNIIKAELLEISAVSVPSNALALAKRKGIDVEILMEKKYGKRKPKNDSDEIKDIAKEPESEIKIDEDKQEEGKQPGQSENAESPKGDSGDQKEVGETPSNQGEVKQTENKENTEVKQEEIKKEDDDPQVEALKKILGITKLLSEILKGRNTEVITTAVKAQKILVINKTIRELLSIKKQ